MRPKKTILLVGHDPDRRGVLRFVLQTQSFLVTEVHGHNAAVEALRVGCFDLLLCDSPLAGLEQLLAAAHQADPFMHTIILTAGPQDDRLIADAKLTAKGLSMKILIDRLKMLGRRKRGPKPARPVDLQPADQARRFA